MHVFPLPGLFPTGRFLIIFATFPAPVKAYLPHFCLCITVAHSHQAQHDHYPYVADVHSCWVGQVTPELLQAAQATLPALSNQPPFGVLNALRWARYKGKVVSVANIGAVLHPQGLPLAYQATVGTSSDRLIVAHVPLGVVPGPKILGYLALPTTKHMAGCSVEKWNPNYKPLDRSKMRTSMHSANSPHQGHIAGTWRSQCDSESEADPARRQLFAHR